MTTRNPRQDPQPGDILMRNGSKVSVILREPDLIAYERNGYMAPEWCHLDKWKRDMVQGIILERADLNVLAK